MGKTGTNTELLPGTLDMLVLETLRQCGPMHGYGVARHIEEASEGILRVGEGSLYPALQRLVRMGCITAEWGVSDHQRRAHFYKLSASGRKRLSAEVENFGRTIGAIARVMRPA